MVALLIEVIDAYCAAFCAAPIVIFLVTGCLLIKCIIEDITNDLALNVNKKITSNKKHEKILKEYFCYLIQDVSEAKQLSEKRDVMTKTQTQSVILIILFFYSRFVSEFNQIFKLIITAYFLWGLLTISSSLLSLQCELVKCVPIVLPFTKLLVEIF